MKSLCFKSLNFGKSLLNPFRNQSLFSKLTTTTTTISAAYFAADSQQMSKVYEDDIHSMVETYYGETLKSSKDLKTNACCATAAPHKTIKDVLKLVPDEVLDRYYGCGNTVPFGIEGLTVVDLGSGSGRDCYIVSHLVGENGKVIGVDMTDEQLDVAKRNADNYCKNVLKYKNSNLEFRKGYIEMLDDPKTANISHNSVDLVISNCVVNLSPRKDQVLQGVYNILKEGGEFYFSDVYCDRRLPKHIREHEVLVGECLGGALYTEDFRRICQNVGFSDPRVLECSEMEVNDPELKNMLGNAKFYSITYRLFKCNGMEDKCEDFGQIGYYNGSIKEHPHYYDLDDHHRFYTNKPMLICGNTALMIGNSWLKNHFKVVGNTDTHYGLFDCSPVKVNSTKEDSIEDSSGTTGTIGSTKGSCC